jgi:phage terminase small subunit
VAAKKAGYRHPNVTGCQILRKLSDSGELKSAMSRLAMDQEEVCARLAAIARANVGDYIDKRGRVVVAAVREKGQAVREFSRGKDGECSVKTHDPQRALELIGKHLGMFSERLELSGADGEPVVCNLQLSEAALKALKGE